MEKIKFKNAKKYKGIIEKIFVKDGQPVNKGDILAQISTQLERISLESPIDGVVRNVYVIDSLIVSHGDTIFDIISNKELETILRRPSEMSDTLKDALTDFGFLDETLDEVQMDINLNNTEVLTHTIDYSDKLPESIGKEIKHENNTNLNQPVETSNITKELESLEFLKKETDIEVSKTHAIEQLNEDFLNKTNIQNEHNNKDLIIEENKKVIINEKIDIVVKPIETNSLTQELNNFALKSKESLTEISKTQSLDQINNDFLFSNNLDDKKEKQKEVDYTNNMPRSIGDTKKSANEYINNKPIETDGVTEELKNLNLFKPEIEKEESSSKVIEEINNDFFNKDSNEKNEKTSKYENKLSNQEKVEINLNELVQENSNDQAEKNKTEFSETELQRKVESSQFLSQFQQQEEVNQKLNIVKSSYSIEEVSEIKQDFSKINEDYSQINKEINNAITKDFETDELLKQNDDSIEELSAFAVLEETVVINEEIEDQDSSVENKDVIISGIEKELELLREDFLKAKNQLVNLEKKEVNSKKIDNSKELRKANTISFEADITALLNLHTIMYDSILDKGIILNLNSFYLKALALILTNFKNIGLFKKQVVSVYKNIKDNFNFVDVKINEKNSILEIAMEVEKNKISEKLSKVVLFDLSHFNIISSNIQLNEDVLLSISIGDNQSRLKGDMILSNYVMVTIIYDSNVINLNDAINFGKEFTSLISNPGLLI
ncbi:biotin/lipoyl-binding protein [Spiroplasma tabanidicola]|uniref:Biotin/lipoyl-binding protein n=1 Tax=Spiroplasma tabanidicola TaxID=324079 RepID=A0A6I6CJE9_9MOLU|nr:biotin/lipoyl-binding protein [Spiroplasma tabanidicola]QGS52203.1 biotin/lipoyl-binding protein [Spiroplasma tabanidicola]